MKTFQIPPEINELLEIRESEILVLEKEIEYLKANTELFAQLAFYEGRLVNEKSSNHWKTKIFEYPTFQGWLRGDRPRKFTNEKP